MAVNADVLDSSEILQHVAHFADARSAERFGVTFGVVMRAVLAIPPQVVLPPTIGGEVSLNMLLAVVGESGGGKGTTDKTASAAVVFSHGGRYALPAQAMLPVGTGEGINRTFARAERDPAGSGRIVLHWHTDRAFFGCRDIATWNALMSRQGSTLVPELLKAWMGEELGFANAEKERRVVLPMHSYRLCLSAGVQPDNGAILLNEQARRDGVPQRFLWMPVRPGEARTRRGAGDARIDPLTVALPTFGIDPMVTPITDADTDGGGFDTGAHDLVPIGVATSIAQEIIDADAVKDLDPFGRSTDPLAGHRLLAQLKLAAGLAVLHNRTDVTAEEWQWAERLIQVSSAVVHVVDVESTTAAERDAARKGHLDGHRLAAADVTRNNVSVQTVMERLPRYLREHPGWVSHSALRRSLTSKFRQHFDDATLALLDEGTIVVRRAERLGRQVVEYKVNTQ